jgi:Xaa-Pro aminopeptidase
MVRTLGAEVVSSAELVTRFYAVWSAEELASHLRAAEIVSQVGRSAIAHAGSQLAAGVPVTEHEIQARILEQFAQAGLEADHGPIVAAGANAADPHYAPSANRPRALVTGELLLVDLWARERNGPGVYADQTWMGSLGPPSDRAQLVWTAVRDARNAAISLLRDRVSAGEPVRGAEADDAAREVITSRGFGEYFTHRTGHSIDARDLHGSGPHLDNLETREERQLVRGVGFSIEPGIYVPGDIGVRSEVNAYIDDGKLLVTPAEYQRDLIVV